MAWSPLAGGHIFKHTDERAVRLLDELRKISQELEARALVEVIFAWILLHPAGIIPIIGSGNRERIRHAISSQELKMDTEQWYRIYNASRGKDLA
jgi:predicted oxidoreductase